jgi:NADPH:quinone reductase-like Zn-dependent oxidoreductase
VKPGDPVFGVTLFNGYSTHVCAAADLVWAKPGALDFEAAAGFLAVHLTASALLNLKQCCVDVRAFEIRILASSIEKQFVLDAFMQI